MTFIFTLAYETSFICMRKLSPRIGLGLVFNKEARTGLYSHTSQWTVVSVMCRIGGGGDRRGPHGKDTEDGVQWV